MEIEIEIINFNQYIKRRDIKTHWFAWDADTLLHPDFLDINGNELKAFLWLLSVAAKIGNSVVRLNIPHTCKMISIKEHDILQCFTKLEKKRVKSMVRNGTVRERNVDVTEPYETVPYITEHNITEHNKTNMLISAKVSEIEFQQFYSKYPKKVGKQKGEKAFKVQIKTPEDLKTINTALSNYLEHLKKNVTDAKYIKQFDTFMNCWREWLDPENGKVNFTAASKRLGTDRVGVDWDKELFGNQLT